MTHTIKIDDEVFTFNASSEDETQLISNIITDLITKSGFVNLDAQDVHAIIDGADKLIAAQSTASGENRSKKAALEVSKDIMNAKNLLLEIETGDEVTLVEMAQAAEIIEKVADHDAQVIWGHVINEKLGDNFTVKIIAVI